MSRSRTHPHFRVASSAVDGHPLAVSRDVLERIATRSLESPPAPVPKSTVRGKVTSLPETWGAIVVDGQFDLDHLPTELIERSPDMHSPKRSTPQPKYAWPTEMIELCRHRPGIFGEPPAQVHVWPADAEGQRRCVNRWVRDADDRPTYLLIVASPQALTLDVEARLASRFVVGRVWFDRDLVARTWPDGRSPGTCLARWARRVVAMDHARLGAPAVTLSTGWTVPDDRLITAFVPRIAPLLDPMDVCPQLLNGAGADTLASAVMRQRPALWMHAGYGAHRVDPVVRGSPLCGGSTDLLDPARIIRHAPAGDVAFLAGCYVGGTTASVPALMVPSVVRAGEGWGPIVDDLVRLRAPTHISGPVMALLGGDDGFGAVVSWYDMLFTSCLGLDDDLLSTEPYGRFVRRLLSGDRLGEAFAGLSRMEQLLRDELFSTGEGPEMPLARWADAFTGWVDYRNVRVFGDPWVRLAEAWYGR